MSETSNRLHESNYSALLVVRRAIATPRLESFLHKVGEKATEFFAPKAVTTVFNEESMAQQLAAGHARPRRPVPIEAVQVHTVDTVELSLFERHAAVSEGMGRLYSRAKERASAPVFETRTKNPLTGERLTRENEMYMRLRIAAKDYKIEDPYEIEAVAIKLQEVTSHDPAYKKFGLVLDPERRSTQYLEKEAEIVHQAIGRLGVGAQIVGNTGPDELYVPLVKIPADANEAVTELFVDAINNDYLARGTDITFGPQKWHAIEPIVMSR